MTQVVQRLHGIHIQTYTFLPQKLRQLRVPSPPLMSGNIKRDHSSFPETLQRLIDGRTFLLFNIHFFYPLTK